MNPSTTSAEFFDRKYREHGDPWNFAHSDYERSRYDAIIAALEHREYRQAFEPGCSVGELTWRLAQRCGHVDAIDISATAVALAEQRCIESRNVAFHVGAIPRRIPDKEYDLIVFSEIGYYFEEPLLRQLLAKLTTHLCRSGTLLAAHWLGASEDHILDGDRVHTIIGETSQLDLEHSERHAGFRLDRWMRT